MTDYADKLLSIAQKKQKLIAEEAKLVEKRKAEIGALAEKLGLLVVSDDFLSGLFHDAKEALAKNTDKVKVWKKQGAQLNKARTVKMEKTSHAQQHTETA